jgi:hypothetical protein
MTTAFICAPFWVLVNKNITGLMILVAEGKNQPFLYSASRETRFFICSVLTAQIIVQKIFMLLHLPLFYSVAKKKLFLGKKFGGAFAPTPCIPDVTPVSIHDYKSPSMRPNF